MAQASVLDTFNFTPPPFMYKHIFDIFGHLVKKNVPQLFERWSCNRIIQGNVQGGLFFSDFGKYP